jgi:hypothetical protein
VPSGAPQLRQNDLLPRQGSESCAYPDILRKNIFHQRAPAQAFSEAEWAARGSSSGLMTPSAAVVRSRGRCSLIAGVGIKPFTACRRDQRRVSLSDHCSLRGQHEPPHHGVGSVGLVMSSTRSR